jgi:hypothetical protein
MICHANDSIKDASTIETNSIDVMDNNTNDIDLTTMVVAPSIDNNTTFNLSKEEEDLFN